MNSGENPDQEKPKSLSARDLEILKFIGRFRLANPEVLHRKFFSTLKWDAMKSTLRRLIGRGPNYRYLRPQEIHGGRVVYLLTRRGARLVGVPLSFCRSVCQTALYQALIVLRFMNTNGGPRRTLLTAKKLRQQMNLPNERFRGNRYFTEGERGTQRLGFLVVDQLGHHRRLCKKIAELLRRFAAKEAFANLFQTRAFKLVLLTVTEKRSRALLDHIHNYLDTVLRGPMPWPKEKGPDRWPVCVEVVPQMLSYLPGRKGQKGP